MPDSEANPARKYKRHTLTDEARADIADDKLGHQEVARKHGLPVHVVKYHREPKEPDRLRKIPLDEKHLLGTLSDAELADRWNVTRAAVHIARKRAKIPLNPKPPKKSLQPL
jgi:hypothetical protein